MGHLLDSLSHLERWLQTHGQPTFRRKQILHWLAQRRAADFQQMSDLPRTLRDQLGQSFAIWSGHVLRRQASEDETEKLLLQWEDGNRIECVLLRDGRRRTICVSSQVGCAMGCSFCASGLDGLDRNLTSGEIIEQMLHLQQLLPAEERLTHIVMMGMGEPLANLDAVLAALQFASSAEGLAISPRRITISTVGLPAAIRRLAEVDPRFNLAVSLHAPDDPLRNRIVPVNDKIGIQRMLQAADDYFAHSGRKLTFEYVLLAGINDSPDQARRLAGLLKGRTALLNVIPYNPVAGLPYRTPSPAVIGRFHSVLRGAGIRVRFRQRKGDQISAACGQLRRMARDAAQAAGPAGEIVASLDSPGPPGMINRDD